MQDMYAEYMVKHKTGAKDLIFQFLIVFVAAVLVAGCIILVQGIGFLLAALAVYGAYYLISLKFLEYEYIFTNGEMDVDKIINRKKRERLITVKSEEIERFSRYRPEEHIKGNYQTKIFAAENDRSAENMCLVVNSRKKGKTLIVFTPNEKISELIKSSAPRSVM